MPINIWKSDISPRSSRGAKSTTSRHKGNLDKGIGWEYSHMKAIGANKKAQTKKEEF